MQTSPSPRWPKTRPPPLIASRGVSSLLPRRLSPRFELGAWRRVLVCSALSSEDAARPGLERLGFKKKESGFVRLIKPLFPFVRHWTLFDKIATTLFMLCVIRGLYFMPIHGIRVDQLPADVQLSSPEQRMLEKIFMAEDSVPLNIAMLGIGPIIGSGYLLQLILSAPVFEYFPGPFKGLLDKKRMGILTRRELEQFSFRMALVLGTVMAVWKGWELRLFAANTKYFVTAVVADLLAALSITRFCCSIIQYHGFGEGTGFLLLCLTLSGFGKRLWTVVTSVQQGIIPLWKVGIVVILYLSTIALCTLFNEVQVRLPLTSYGMMPTVGNDPLFRSKPSDGQAPVSSAPYYPLPISQTAISALFLSSGVVWHLNALLQKWPAMSAATQSTLGQMLIYASIAFLIALVPLGQNAKNISEYFSGMEVGIRGVIPGEPTVKHLQKKLFQSQVLGACFLFVTILCCMSLDILCIEWLGTAIGTLNLVLLVAVISSAFKTMEAHLDSMRVGRVLQKEKSVVEMLRHSRATGGAH